MANVKLKLKANQWSEEAPYYDIDKFNGLKSVTSTTQSSTNASEIQYGILSNTGSATVIDSNGEIGDLIKRGLLPYNGIDCNIELNGNQIQHHITRDSNYNEDKILSLSFTDSLDELSKKTFPGMPLHKDTNAFGVLSYIYSTMGYCRENVSLWEKYKMPEAFLLDALTNKITVSTGSGWEIIGFPIYISEHRQYKLKFKYSMPSYTAKSGFSGGVSAHILYNYPNADEDAGFNIPNTMVSLGTSAASNKEITISFYPNTGNWYNSNHWFDKVYFALNFGRAADSQSLNMTLESISIDDKEISTSDMLQSQVILNNGDVGTVKQHLDSILINLPYLEQSSYTEAINKICALAQLNLIEDDNGSWKFVTARPNVTTPENIYRIPKYMQETKPSDSLFVKNKINSAGCTYSSAALKIGNIFDQTINFSVESVDGDTSSTMQAIVGGDEAITDDSHIEGNNVRTEYLVDGKYHCFQIVAIPISNKLLFDANSLIIESSYPIGIDSNSDTRYILKSSFGVYNSFRMRIRLPFSFTHENISVINFDYFDTGWDFLSENLRWSVFDSTFYTLNPQNGDLANCYGIVPDGNGGYILYGFIYKGYKMSNGSTYTYYFKTDYKLQLSGAQLDLTERRLNSDNVDYEIEPNELLQSASILQPNIANIVNDYKDGLKSTEIRIKLMDLYNLNGVKSKDYSLGQVLKIGDIVEIDKDNFGTSAFLKGNGSNIFWRVVGRGFDYSGVPAMTLQLQETLLEIVPSPPADTVNLSADVWNFDDSPINDVNNILGIEINGKEVSYYNIPSYLSAGDTIKFIQKTWDYGGDVYYFAAYPRVNGSSYTWGTTINASDVQEIEFSCTYDLDYIS